MRSGFGWIAGLVVAGVACSPKAPTAVPGQRSPAPAASAADTDRATIEVTRAAIALDGRALADAESIAVRRRLVRVEELHRALKGRKRNVDARHPSSAQQTLTVAADASPEAALSAMVTAAWAGYERIHATVENAGFDATYVLASSKPGQYHSIVSVTKLGNDLDLSWQTDASCSAAPRGARIQKGALSNWLRLTCSRLPQPCVDMVALSVGTDDTFEDVAAVFRAFQQHSDNLHVSVSRWIRTPTETTEGSECGHEVAYEDSVTPPSFVRETVRQGAAAFRACYQTGLERDRWLEGIVAVRFTIGKDGRASSVEPILSKDDVADVVWPSGESAVTTITDRDVVTCIVGEFQHLTFPPRPGRPLKAVYPMKFSYEQK